MRRAVLAVLLAALLATSLSAQAAEYVPTFDSLRTLSLRTDSAAGVRNVTLVRDSLVFHLDSGTLFFARAVGGRVPGVEFTGRGTVSIAPPYDIERHELRRLLHDSSTTWNFTTASFLALDSTVAELRHRVTEWHPGDDGVARDAWSHFLSYLFDERSKLTRDPALLAGILNADTTGFLLAHVERTEGEGLTFRYDVRESEGMAVRHDFRGGETMVSSFPLTSALSDSEPEMASDPEVRAGPYTISAVVDPRHSFKSVTVFRFTTARARTRWVQFELTGLLHADSLTEDGHPVPYFQPPHTSSLWIHLPEGRHPGDTVALRLVDHGDLIGDFSIIGELRRDYPGLAQLAPGNPDQWYLVKDCLAWYPRYDYSQPLDLDLTYRVPREYQFVSVGRLTDSTSSGDTVITHWRTEHPTVWACFNVGQMDEQHVSDPRIPPVVVQMNTKAHTSLNNFVGEETSFIAENGGTVGGLANLTRSDALEEVSGDVVNSLSFFTHQFGAPLYSRYYATEVPFDYGEAFPGMIYLSNSTYLGTRYKGFDEIFRSHEMAHQWWGIGIMPAGTRDAWLQEGFANFSGLWYMQRILQDSTKFFNQLDRWRDDLVKRGADVAPLGVGFRLLGAEQRGDYDLIVYEKGAWVLQMLRNLMLDFRTFKEDGFTGVMRDFYTRFRGQKASIQDFQRVVEEHTDQPMGWFFDEWVNGSAIPTYTFSWHADTAVNGEMPLHFRVRQTGVPDGFVMPVPVEVKFAGGRHIYLHLTVRGPLTEGTVSVSALPTAVFLNPLGSVLATVKTEAWQP